MCYRYYCNSLLLQENRKLVLIYRNTGHHEQTEITFRASDENLADDNSINENNFSRLMFSYAKYLREQSWQKLGRIGL